jgi:hypothetical protein
VVPNSLEGDQVTYDSIDYPVDTLHPRQRRDMDQARLARLLKEDYNPAMGGHASDAMVIWAVAEEDQRNHPGAKLSGRRLASLCDLPHSTVNALLCAMREGGTACSWREVARSHGYGFYAPPLPRRVLDVWHLPADERFAVTDQRDGFLDIEDEGRGWR